jgi:hypothetical protein
MESIAGVLDHQKSLMPSHHLFCQHASLDGFYICRADYITEPAPLAFYVHWNYVLRAHVSSYPGRKVPQIKWIVI